jgi:hypothetical protein
MKAPPATVAISIQPLWRKNAKRLMVANAGNE